MPSLGKGQAQRGRVQPKLGFRTSGWTQLLGLFLPPLKLGGPIYLGSQLSFLELKVL